MSGKSLQDAVPWGGAGSLGHALLEPTLIYVKRLLALGDAVQVKASAHSVAMQNQNTSLFQCLRLAEIYVDRLAQLWPCVENWHRC